MATFQTTTAQPTHVGSSVAGRITEMMQSFAMWNDTRKTRNALSKLTTRELEDIGLTPSDIHNL